MFTEKHGVLFAGTRCQTGALHHLNSNADQYSNESDHQASQVITFGRFTDNMRRQDFFRSLKFRDVVHNNLTGSIAKT